jgi:Na+/H+-dicarboxylate symporter
MVPWWWIIIAVLAGLFVGAIARVLVGAEDMDGGSADDWPDWR